MWKQWQIYSLGLWNHCRWWLEPRNQKTVASWQECYDKLRVLKSRGITLPTKVHIVKAMVFQVVTYGCENWTIRKEEHQGIDAFKLWCWRRFLRILWTARKSNKSILNEISLEYSTGNTDAEAEAPVFDHLMQTAVLLEKSLMLGKIESRKRRDVRGWDGWMVSLIQWACTWANSGRLWEIGRPGVLQAMGHKELDMIGHPNNKNILKFHPYSRLCQNFLPF